MAFFSVNKKATTAIGQRKEIHDLWLLAKRQANNESIGLHPQQQYENSREFERYRAYQPGDDFRFVDWKLYGRSDRFFVRESKKKKAHHWHFLVDASASMWHNENGKVKWLAVIELLSYLLAICEVQNDHYSVTLLGNNVPLPSQQDPVLLLSDLRKVKPESTSSTFALPLEKEGSSMLISDLHKLPKYFVEQMSNRAGRSSLAVVHLLGAAEMGQVPTSWDALIDLESSEKAFIDSAAFSSTIESRLSAIESKWTESGSDYFLMDYTKLLYPQIRTFLLKRSIQL